MMAFVTFYGLLVVVFACLYRIADLTTPVPQFSLHALACAHQLHRCAVLQRCDNHHARRWRYRTDIDAGAGHDRQSRWCPAY